jgi:hypothetical protein
MEGKTRAPLIGSGKAGDERFGNGVDGRRWWWILNASTITRRGNGRVARRFSGGEEAVRASQLLGDRGGAQKDGAWRRGRSPGGGG